MGMSAKQWGGRALVCAAMTAGISGLGPSSTGLADAAALPASFGSEGPGAGQFLVPRGVAIDQESGVVYVADRNNNRVDKFTGEGGFLLAWGWGVADGKGEALQSCTTTCFPGSPGTGAGQLKGPEGIAVDNSFSLSRHDVYVADVANNRVEKFDPEGEFLLAFGGEFKGLTGRAVAVDSTGTVYVGDENRVQEFSETGVVTGEIALPGMGLIENLAVDSAKDIYVKGSLLAGVRKFDGTGKELGEPRDEAGEGVRQAIAIGPLDGLFVNGFQSGIHHILTYDSSGTQVASFDPGGFPEDGRRGIAYSEVTEVLYVATETGVRIVVPPSPGPYVLPGSERIQDITPTSAKLEVTANPEGGAGTRCHFEYGTTTAYGSGTPEVELTSGTFEEQVVSASISGLAPSTTYHFLIVCENAAKEAAEGIDGQFTTLPPVSIDGTSASQVDATSARLEADLNPHGLESEYRFEYGTTTSYGNDIPVPDGSVGSGNTDTTVHNLIQELLPATVYHYRVVAHNELGTMIGPDRIITTQGVSSLLPDGRTWEQVSPPNKHGAPLEPLTEEGGLIQAAVAGGGFAYVALGPISGDPQGVRSPHDSQLLAARSSSGWSSQDISTPHEEISLIHVGVPSEYKFFAEDLFAGIVEPEGVTALSTETTERTPYRREADGQFVPLVTAANVPTGLPFGGKELESGSGQWGDGVEFRTATPDGSHLVLESPQSLVPGFNVKGIPNLYDLAGGQLTLLSILPSGQAAAEAGFTVGLGHNDLSTRGASSSDGNRVVFETGTGDGHLYLRDVARKETLRLDRPQEGAVGGTGKAVFQAANSDGTKVFFTDASRLTADSTAQPEAPDLYMCAVKASAGTLECALSDLSADHNPGEAANVQGELSAIDANGDHVYFAANGALTSAANARGEHALPGICNSATEANCNLYEYDTLSHQLTLVAVLSSQDDPDWAGRTSLHNLGNLTARSSPDGRYFTFMSRRSLTGYDNRDAQSGEPDAEVFQLDSTSGVLRCISCDPTGGRPQGMLDQFPSFPGPLVDHPHSWGERWISGSIPSWTLQSHSVALYQPRYLTNSGREFFNSTDALVPQDKNSVEDVYEFEPPGVGDCADTSSTYSALAGGCIGLVSSGSAKEESAFLDASESGDEVFFLTQARLTTTDIDSAFDVYDAHVCTSSSPCPPPPAPPSPACQGDACQNPSAPPKEETPSSLTYKGPGNAVPQTPAPPAKPRPPTRAQLLAKALRSCKTKKPKKKRVSCERSARTKYGSKKAAKAKAKKRAKGSKATHGRRGR